MARSKKTLVVFYSRTGTTRRLAMAIAQRLHADIEEVRDNSDRRGLRGYWRSLLDAVWRRPAKIAPAERDPGLYEVTIIGTPVWASAMSAPIRSYLLAHKPRLGAVAFFCTLGGRGGEAAFAQMARLLEKEPRARCAVTQRDIATGRSDAAVARFATALETVAAVGSRGAIAAE